MDLYEKNGNILYILNVLKKYSDEEHKLSISELKEKIKEEYGEDIDPRTIRRNINLLQQKFGYDISTYNDNKIGYYISNDPETDFEPGEIRAIIDTFSYSTFIEQRMAKGIIRKCKNLQNVYENEKIKNYRVYSPKGRTNNVEVIKNIEDISNSIMNKNKVKFEYWKYCIVGDRVEKQIVSTPVVSPYAIIYDKQQFYMLAIKDGNKEFYHYRLDRIKNLKELAEIIKISKSEKDIEQYADTSVEVFSGDEVEIEAECNEYLLGEVIEKFGKNVEIAPINKDSFKMKLKVNPFGFKLWAMRNLDLVEVKKPINLRSEIIKIIEDASNKYLK
ncbi:MAG: WYL domain-containing protein [Clostridia bacterium]|nr:WYL domain-containing protein [Clostridia bacterium]